jgi:prevent-host-death family protein
MRNWQASNARVHLPEIIDAAVAGEPQLVQRRDGKAVVVVSREYFETTKPTLKSFLLGQGYSGEGEDEFDKILEVVRASSPNILARVDPAPDD